MGEGDGVDVAGGAEDVEVLAGAVEEGKAVSHCTDDPVGDGLRWVVGAWGV